MFKLVANEIFKTVFRLRTYISMIMIMVIAGSMALLPIFFTDSSVSKSFSGENWKQETANHVEQLERTRNVALKNMEKEADPESQESVINQAEYNELSEEIDKLNYSMEHEIPPVSTNNLFNNLISASKSSTLITVLTVIIAASIISDEYKYGTINLLLIRPVGRTKILFSKFLTISACIGVFMLLAILSTLFVSVFTSDMNQSWSYIYTSSDGNIHHDNFTFLLGQNLLAQFFSILIIALIPFSLSIIIPSQSLIISLTLAIYFSADPVFIFLEQYTDAVKFLWFPYWDLNQFLPPYQDPSNGTMTTALVVNSLYSIPFILLVFYMFRRKDILI